MCAGWPRWRRSSEPGERAFHSTDLGRTGDVSMRTIECNVCGEPLTGHDDEALVRRLVEHVTRAHPDARYDEDLARREVAEEAYTASDN